MRISFSLWLQFYKGIHNFVGLKSHSEDPGRFPQGSGRKGEKAILVKCFRAFPYQKPTGWMGKFTRNLSQESGEKCLPVSLKLGDGRNKIFHIIKNT